MGVYDVLLRVEHTVSGSEGARRAINALTSTEKNIGETGNKMRQSLTTWLKGGVPTTEEAAECTESSPLDEDTPSAQKHGRGMSSRITSSEREQIANKVRSLSSWIRGTRSDETGSTSQSPSEQ